MLAGQEDIAAELTPSEAHAALPAIKSAAAKLRGTCLERIAKTGLGQADEREHLYYTVQALDGLVEAVRMKADEHTMTMHEQQQASGE